METLTICYDFKFCLDVRKRNGKTYKRHLILGLGANYGNALWDAYFKLKKRKTEILKVNTVEVSRIAFAYQGKASLKLKLAEYPPEIPADLNDHLKYLPKTEPKCNL